MKYLRIAALLLGAVLMVWGAVTLVRNHLRSAEVHGWPRAQARITDSRVDILHRTEVGNAGDFLPHVRYDYVVNGRTYHGDTLYLDERRSFDSTNVAARELVFLETGTETEVMYNPADPREAALIVDKPTWRYFFLFLLGGLLAWLGWGFWRVRAQPQQPMAGMPPGMQPQPGMQMPAGMQPGMQAPPGGQLMPGLQMQAQPQPGQAQPRPPVQPQSPFAPGGHLVTGPAPKPR